VQDVAAWLYSQGLIDFLLVIGPNGVHENWVADELPAHMPEWTNYRAAVWRSNMKKAEQEAVDEVFSGWREQHPRPLRVLAMNLEAFSPQERFYKKKAGLMARAVLNSFNVMMVVDESSFIKNYVACTQRIVELGKHAKYRRILNGTPITQGPLDLYYQFKFLNGGGLRPAGQGDFLLGPYSTNMASFKGRYAEYEEVELRQPRRDPRTGRVVQTHYPNLVGYRNLEELSEHLEQCSTRRTKKDCLDLPDKLYEKLPVELHKEQARRYKKVVDEGILELKRDGAAVNVTNVLSMWLRLQQILGGFVPSEDPEENIAECIFDDPKDNPRVQQFMHYIDQAQSGKVIIYCRFLAEVAMWKEIYGDRAVTYIGAAHYKDQAKRQENKVRFCGTKDNNFEDHDPTVDILIANKAFYRGHTAIHTSFVFYYSNGFSLDDRLQSEDRAHRIGQKNAVTYLDGVAEGTIDERLVDAFREKKRLADTITKDKPTTWV
jgi:hypothetical protein